MRTKIYLIFFPQEHQQLLKEFVKAFNKKKIAIGYYIR